MLLDTCFDIVDMTLRNMPQVRIEAIEEKMRKHGIDIFIKTSAKTGENVQQVFEKIAQRQSGSGSGGRGTETAAQTVNIRRQDRPGAIAEKMRCC